MKIVTYNVNGIRAAMNKGLVTWLAEESPDVLCLQEIKASPEQLDCAVFENMGYHLYWHPAVKKGYSGVAIFSRERPKHVEIGCGIKTYDDEGRVLRADFGDISVMSVYHPSGSSGEERQAFKFRWLDDFRNYVSGISAGLPGLVLSGDFNICHREIDIHNPVANAKTSGFLPEERAWMESFINSGFIDSFRHLNPHPHQYSWWTYRAGARSRNLGWRIDYNLVSSSLTNRIKASAMRPDALHSDHCPVVLELH